MTAYNDDSRSFTYRDKNGTRVVAYKIHFTSPYGISSSRRWWAYLWDMTPDNYACYIEEWYNAGLINDAQLWDVLGSFGSPISAAMAVEIYEALGLEPLAGFPLVKKEVA